MSAVKFLGKYYLHEKIGTTAGSQLFRAMEIGSNGFERVVRIHRLKDELVQDEAKRRLLTETFEQLQPLRNPNLIELTDFLNIREDWILVREFVHGVSLRHILSRLTQSRQNLTQEESLYIGRELFRGLKAIEIYGESHGVVMIHGHIHPENVLVSYDGDVKLNGLGVAEFFETTGEIQTQPYLSLEQLDGKPLDPRSDIYSAGSVLLEMLSGKPPFIGASIEQINSKIRTGINMGAVEERKIPRDIGKFLCKAMEVRRDWRYLDPVEAEEALSGLLARPKLEEQKKNLAERLRTLFAQEIQREKSKVLEEHRVVAKLLGSEMPGDDELFVRKIRAATAKPAQSATKPAQASSLTSGESVMLRSGDLTRLLPGDEPSPPAAQPQSPDFAPASQLSSLLGSEVPSPTLSLLSKKSESLLPAVKAPTPEMPIKEPFETDPSWLNKQFVPPEMPALEEASLFAKAVAAASERKPAVEEKKKNERKKKEEETKKDEAVIDLVYNNDLAAMMPGGDLAAAATTGKSPSQARIESVPSITAPPPKLETTRHASPPPKLETAKHAVVSPKQETAKYSVESKSEISEKPPVLSNEPVSIGFRPTHESRTTWRQKLEELGTKPSGPNYGILAQILFVILLLVGIAASIATLFRQ